MAMSGVYVITAPAAAAAMGLYFFGRNNLPNNQEVGGAGIGANVKKEVKSGGGGGGGGGPMLAPQFDGLHCFETIVPK
ncbi:hypothetical protein ABFS83_06G097200 [Erythranthe nasuta]